MQARGSMDAAAKASRNKDVPSCLVPYELDERISSLTTTVAKRVSKHLIHRSFGMCLTDLSSTQIRISLTINRITHIIQLEVYYMCNTVLLCREKIRRIL